MSFFDQRGRKFLLSVNVILSALLVCYHVGLDRFYCLSADDFAGIDYASEGIPGLGYAWRFYLGWEGPFLSMVVQGLLMGSVAAGMPPFIGLLIVKLALVLSTVILLRATSTRFKIEWSWQEIWLAALIFNVCLYLISPEPSQIWHWLIGTVYLVPLIFLQLGTAALLVNRFWLAIIPFAFVMQSRATYAVLIFGFLWLLAIFNWWKKSENRRQWMFLLIFLLVFLAIYLVAPGNYVRVVEQGIDTSISFTFLLTQFRIGLQNLLVSYNIAKMDRVLLGLMAVLPIVGLSASVPRPKEAWFWLIPVVLYLGFAIAHETLFVYITGYREWTRVLSLHSFLFLSTMFIYGFWSFSYVPVSWKKNLQYASIIAIGGLLFQFFNDFGHQLEIGKELKTKYDARMAYILDYRGVADTFYVQPMNYEGILYFEDFSEDPDNWINKDFVKAYNLDFKVALKKQDEK